MKHNIKTYLLYAVFFISMMTNFILAIKVNHPNGNGFLAEETAIAQDTLSEWNIFTLALMKVESEYNNNAVSSVGAKKGRTGDKRREHIHCGELYLHTEQHPGDTQHSGHLHTE